MIFSHEMDGQIKSSPDMLVQCRICHEEDEDSNMETPCSCCGSLKYAHRQCVQRWCNEKGDTTCEICQQQFKPGYTATAPSPLFHYAGSPLNLGGNWEILGTDLDNHRFIAMVTDNHPAPSRRSLIRSRIVAVIFTVLLVFRHIIPIIFLLSGAGKFSLTVFMLMALRTTGALLSVYTMVKAFTAIQRRQYQDHHFSPMQSHEENDSRDSQLRVIHIW